MAHSWWPVCVFLMAYEPRMVFTLLKRKDKNATEIKWKS